MRARILTVCVLAGVALAQQTAPPRKSLAQLGVYTDYRVLRPAAKDAGDRASLLRAAKASGAAVVILDPPARGAGLSDGVLFLAGPIEGFPAGEGGMTAHLLARELTESAVRESVAERRWYLAQDSLGDPTGFGFGATNNNGVYDIGDRTPMIARTRLVGLLPMAARVRILHNGKTVAEANDSQISFTPTDTGDYRLEASLSVGGEMRPWIETSPIHMEPVVGRGITIPSLEMSPTVEVRKDIPYVEGQPDDANKHKLDLYLPKGKTGFPVLIFIHGGNWRSGDRLYYLPLGNRFAKEGIGVAVPSYRLMPGAPHPAQIEDAIAAVDWVIRNIAQHGGDPKRIFLGGHSAGGHLAAYAGLEKRFWPNLKGVVALSGVYDVTPLPAFKSDTVDGSPLHRITAGAPPFLITYCQNDYPSLPAEARNFHAALQKAGISSELVYVPGKSHISEMVDIWQDDDPTARAVLRFIRSHQ